MYCLYTLLTVFVLFYLNISSCIATNLTDLTDWDTYTEQELKLIPVLRNKVEDELKHRCMFQNKYLVRYLRATNNDVDNAEKLLRNFFDWRKLHDIDNMVYKDFSKLNRQLPFYFVESNNGRPALTGEFRNFNIRKASLTLNGINYFRQYTIYTMERAVWNIHLVSNRTKRELIEGYLLFNLAGFTTRTHACAACIPLWIEFVASYERYYPWLAYEIIAINAPRVFQSLFSIIKPFAQSHTLKITQIYGVNKGEWFPVLNKIFPMDRLEISFGGTTGRQSFYTVTKEQAEYLLGPKYAETYWPHKNSSSVS